MERTSTNALNEAIDTLHHYFSPANLIGDKLLQLLLEEFPQGADLHYINRNFPKLRQNAVSTVDLYARLQDDPVLSVCEADGRMYIKPRVSLSDFRVCYVVNLPQYIRFNELSETFGIELFCVKGHFMCKITPELESQVVQRRSVQLQQRAFEFYQQHHITWRNVAQFKDQIREFMQFTATLDFEPVALGSLIERPRVVKITGLPDGVSRQALQQALHEFGAIKYVRLGGSGQFAQVFFGSLSFDGKFPETVNINGTQCQCQSLQ